MLDSVLLKPLEFRVPPLTGDGITRLKAFRANSRSAPRCRSRATSRDFAHWRFSNARRRRGWMVADLIRASIACPKRSQTDARVV